MCHRVLQEAELPGMAEDFGGAAQAASQHMKQQMAHTPSLPALNEATLRQTMSAQPTLRGAGEALPAQPSTLQVSSCLHDLGSL